MAKVFNARLVLGQLDSEKLQAILDLLDASYAIGEARESYGSIENWPKAERKYLDELTALRNDWRKRQ